MALHARFLAGGLARGSCGLASAIAPNTGVVIACVFIGYSVAYGTSGSTFGAEFHDFVGSMVVRAVAGWIGLAAVLLLGARSNRYRQDGSGRSVISAHPPPSIPFVALGKWILTGGWFGSDVMSAQTLEKISGLVVLNSLMVMVASTAGRCVAFADGWVVYAILRSAVGIRLSQEEEFEGADLPTHKIGSTPNREVSR